MCSENLEMCQMCDEHEISKIQSTQSWRTFIQNYPVLFLRMADDGDDYCSLLLITVSSIPLIHLQVYCDALET